MATPTYQRSSSGIELNPYNLAIDGVHEGIWTVRSRCNRLNGF